MCHTINAGPFSANKGQRLHSCKGKVFISRFFLLLIQPICSDKIMMNVVQLHNRTVQATACAQYLSLAFTSSGLSPELKSQTINNYNDINEMFFKWNQDLLTRARDLPVCNWVARGRWWWLRIFFSWTHLVLLIIQELLAHGVTKL